MNEDQTIYGWKIKDGQVVAVIMIGTITHTVDTGLACPDGETVGMFCDRKQMIYGVAGAVFRIPMVPR